MIHFQDQLSRCAMTCYDKLLQQHGPDVNKYSESTVRHSLFFRIFQEFLFKFA